MPHEQRVYIVGLQRSGTTWLQCLLHNNFALEVRSAHKHELPYGLNNWGQELCLGRQLKKSNEPVVFIEKPFKFWFGSILRRPTNTPKMYPYIYDGQRPNREKAKKLHDQFYEDWNYLGLNLYYLDYIELLRDTINELKQIGGWLKLNPIGQSWELGGSDPQWNESRRAYYLDGDSDNAN